MKKLLNPEVRIETTNICNAQCVMCPREKLTRKQSIMEMSFFKKLIDDVKKYGAERIFLGGYGEPLTDPHLVERVRYVKSKGLFCNFISNGSLWDEGKSRDLIDAGLDEVRISFYGTKKETYDAVHKGLTYEVTYENLKRLALMKRENLKILVFFLLLEENNEEKEEFIRTWEPLVDVVEVWRAHNWSNGRDYRKLDTVKRTCGRPASGPLQVQWDGTVIPCCWDYNGEMILGDLKTQTISEVFHDPRYEKLRRAHERADFSDFPFCDGCDQLHEHKDAIVYSNRHEQLEEAVSLTNSALYTLKNENHA